MSSIRHKVPEEQCAIIDVRATLCLASCALYRAEAFIDPPGKTLTYKEAGWKQSQKPSGKVARF